MTAAISLKPRLFVEAPLGPGQALDLPPASAHYLGQVLRSPLGARVALFNGRDGEWAAVIVAQARRTCRVETRELLRPQAPEPGPSLLFAPLKRTRQELLVEKAVELGVQALQPVRLRRGVVERVNPERMRAIAIEAAEQCGRLTLPALADLRALADCLPAPAGPVLYVGDETGGGQALLAAFAAHGPGDLLVGPEGGFDPAELELLRRSPKVVPVDLGPRILRAETAAIAALAAWQLTFAAAG